MDHLEWLMELQNEDSTILLPQLSEFAAKTVKIGAEQEELPVRAAKKADAVQALQASVNRAVLTDAVLHRETAGQTVVHGGRNTVPGAAWEAAGGETTISMEQISRFFELDARRFG